VTRVLVAGSAAADARSRAYSSLARRDPVLRRLVAAVGRPDPFAWDGGDVVGDDLFAGLALHIVGQQISIPAALTIFGRLGDAAGGRPPSARAVAALDPSVLRAVGLSTAKSRALHELAIGVDEGKVDLAALRGADDADAIERLRSLRGVGPWSAQMFLIHQLHRPDVLPAGDVGIRHAVHGAFGLPERPSEPDVAARASAWAPYRTYAAALLWASASTNWPNAGAGLA
jgi:DNA-3-methyladenine glycosylase II